MPISLGTLFIVSAPSGAGKTSLVRALSQQVADLIISTSHTTRPRRASEVAGVDYFFVDEREFQRMVEAGEFLEHARVFDYYYGTARHTVTAAMERGQDVLLEIDWQGARQVRAALPGCVSIFILPPSRGALAARLTARGRDDAATIARRMAAAVSELSHHAEYDYLVVNDVFQQALDDLSRIVTAERLRTARQVERYRELIADLLA